MDSWGPATEAEVVMRDVLRSGDQEQYFRVLARLDLLLPVSADSAGRRSPGWGTWSSDGRTHVLAFTSLDAMWACLAEHAGSYRVVAFRELAAQWPNPEWWLAVNPGLPIEGYLPAWFVTQISRGDVRLPGRTMGSRARMDHASSIRRRAAGSPPRNEPAPERAAPNRAPAAASGSSVAAAQSGAATQSGTGLREQQPAAYADRPASRAERWSTPPERYVPGQAERYSTGPGDRPGGTPGERYGGAQPDRYATGPTGPTDRAAAVAEGPTIPLERSRTRVEPAPAADRPPKLAERAPRGGESAPVVSGELQPPAGLGARLAELQAMAGGFSVQPVDVPSAAGPTDETTRLDEHMRTGEPSRRDEPPRRTWSDVQDDVTRPLDQDDLTRPLDPAARARSGEPVSGQSARPADPVESIAKAGPVRRRDAQPAQGLWESTAFAGFDADDVPTNPIAPEHLLESPSTTRPEPYTRESAATYGSDSAQAYAADPASTRQPGTFAPPAYPPAAAYPSGAPAAVGTASAVHGPPATTVPGRATAQPSAPEPPGPVIDEDYDTANATEADLLAASRSGNNDRFLSILLLAKLLVPGHAIDPELWPTEEINGERYLVTFTSEERLAERKGPVDAPTVRFTSLIVRWPGDDLGFAVNPDTPVGATLSGIEVRTLANWAAEVGLIDAREHEPEPPPPEPPVRRARPAPRPVPEATPFQPLLMQRTIAASQAPLYLERGYDRVSGFVHRASEIAHLQTPEELYRALGLGYSGSPFRLDDPEVYVLRWPAYCPSLYQIPFGGQTEAGMHAMQGWVIERAPFRGNGFAPSETSDVVAEFKVDSTRLPHGAQLWRVTHDATETLIALFDADTSRWRPIGDD